MSVFRSCQSTGGAITIAPVAKANLAMNPKLPVTRQSVMGMLDQVALAKAGFEVRIAPQAVTVADHAVTTGIIPLETSERPAIPTRMRPGTGCQRDGLRADKRDLAEIPDDGEHELATCYAVRGLGLVVIASCSHRGVLNSVRPRTADEARQTVAAFIAIDPSYIVPMHCTGEMFIEEALRQMPQKIIRPYVGTRLVMG